MGPLVCLTLAVLAITGTQAPLLLSPGDRLSLVTPNKDYNAEFNVMSDGAIYGLGFGRVVVAGRTWAQARNLVREALRNTIRPERVELILLQQGTQNVFLLGAAQGSGQLEWKPNTSLRQLLSQSPPSQAPELLNVHLFRAGRRVDSANLAFVMTAPGFGDSLLEPGDVVSLVPEEGIHVWVSGLVPRSGRHRIPPNSTASQAVAFAGGLTQLLGPEFAAGDEATIVHRRGPDTTRHTLNGASDSLVLQDGDTLTVEGPSLTRISVGGEVVRQGEVIAKGPLSVNRAVSLAGGPTPEGTLSRVLVLRGSEVIQIDASGPVVGKPGPATLLETGDQVFVQKNVRQFFVLGLVNNPSRYLMEDGREYRLADAIAQAGGLAPRGVFRRIFVARPGPDGKFTATQYNLDAFLRDGKLEANPVIEPGNVVLVNATDDINLRTILSQLGSLFVLETLVGRT